MGGERPCAGHLILNHKSYQIGDGHNAVAPTKEDDGSFRVAETLHVDHKGDDSEKCRQNTHRGPDTNPVPGEQPLLRTKEYIILLSAR